MRTRARNGSFAGLAALSVLLAAASQAQPEDRFIDVDGLRIHYLDWGTAGKRPLILFHGIGRVAHTFDPVAPHFLENFHVLAVDMRGHGDSGWDPGGNYLVRDYVRDIEGLVEQLGLDDIVLWGNSTGGRVAQVYAALHPERVSALIVEDVGPERPPSIAGRLAERIRREEAGWASEDELFAELERSSPRTASEVLRAHAHYGSHVRSSDGRTIFKRDPRINEGFVPTDLWEFVREIEAPTIYILGGASSIVPPETQQALREALPQVQIEIMPGLGHYPSEEDRAGFLSIVDRFLSRALVTQDSFVGVYKLAGFAPHGDEPTGRISYDTAGRVWAMLTPPGRSPISNSSSADEYRAAMQGLVAYYGTYDVDAATGRVTHHVESASNPRWIGTDLVRWYRFEGDYLTLSLNPEFTNTLLWERLPDTGAD